MSDTNVTAPPGLSVCCHLWEASWAFASVSISQTVVRPENSYTLPTLCGCQDDFACKNLLRFTRSCSFFPFFPFSLLTSLHPPHHLCCIRWDWVWSFSLLSLRQGIATVCELCACDGRRCSWVVGSSSLLDLLFPPNSHPVAALKWGPSAECLCVSLPNPHKDPSLCHKFI